MRTSGLGQAVASRSPFAAAGDRRQRVAGFADSAGMDGIVAVGSRYATWLAGYSGYGVGPSAVVLDADRHFRLIVPADEVPLAERASLVPVVSYGEPGFGLDIDLRSTLLAALGSFSSVADAARLGVAGIDRATAVSALGPAVLSFVDDDLRRLAQRKDVDEAEAVGHAYELCWSAQRAVAAVLADGASEIEMYTAAQRAAQIAHGAPVDFVCDLLAGEHTLGISCPAAVAGHRRPSATEPVIADIALGASGYWGDSCETYVVGASDEVSQVRGALLRVLSEAAATLRPGISGQQVHSLVTDLLSDAFPGTHLPHHAGHGVGLTAFESPHLVPMDTTPLEEGQILALEPGIYHAGVGVRVERLFVVTVGGGEELPVVPTPNC